MEDIINVLQTGISLTAGASSTSATIPNNLAGIIPRYIRLASTQPIYVKVGMAGITAVAGDLLISPGDATVVSVHKNTTVACLQAGTGGILQVSPLENS